MKCPYKVEETERNSYGCSYNADKFYGNYPTPKCGFPVTLTKVQNCSKRHKIKICKNCGGIGYIKLLEEQKQK